MLDIFLPNEVPTASLLAKSCTVIFTHSTDEQHWHSLRLISSHLKSNIPKFGLKLLFLQEKLHNGSSPCQGKTPVSRKMICSLPAFHPRDNKHSVIKGVWARSRELGLSCISPLMTAEWFMVVSSKGKRTPNGGSYYLYRDYTPPHLCKHRRVLRCAPCIFTPGGLRIKWLC